jgi:hypothetical protein
MDENKYKYKILSSALVVTTLRNKHEFHTLLEVKKWGYNLEKGTISFTTLEL